MTKQEDDSFWREHTPELLGVLGIGGMAIALATARLARRTRLEREFIAIAVLEDLSAEQLPPPTLGTKIEPNEITE